MKYARQQAKRVWILIGMVSMMWAAGQQVTNTNDAGAGSLRDVIGAAANGANITFAAALAGETITLGSELTIFRDNLTINASGLANPVTIRGGGNFSTLRHVGVGTFVINNLVVTGGNNRVTSNGNITVTNSTISGNMAANGSGISGGGNVTVTDSIISGNTAVGGFGGGIFSDGNITVTNSTISGNTAGTGGGIRSGGNVTITDSTISGNTANFNGGGIDSVGTTTITNSTISGNTVNNGNGGGMRSGGNVTLSGCVTIENNTANTGAQWNVTGTVTDDNGTLAAVVDAPYAPCATSGSVINPNPDMQIRNGSTLDAESITSGAIEPLRYGTFKRGQTVVLDFLVRNPGAKVLEIGELSLPSFLSVAGEPLPETLASFESALLSLAVDTSSAGQFTGEISLASNDPDAFENPFHFDVVVTVSNEPANALNILPGIDLGDITAVAGEQSVVLLSFQLIVPEGSVSVTVDSLTLAASNAGIERASKLQLFIDGGTRGELDNRDVFLASTTDTQALTFTFPARTLQPELPMWLIVVGDF